MEWVRVCTKYITVNLPSFFFQREVTMSRNLFGYVTNRQNTFTKKSYMRNANFSNLGLKICMEKKKPVCPRFYWNLTSSISVCSRSNVKWDAGWSIFLCHLSENECSEQALENFRKGKIFHQQKFFIGINFRRH